MKNSQVFIFLFFIILLMATSCDKLMPKWENVDTTLPELDTIMLTPNPTTTTTDTITQIVEHDFTDNKQVITNNDCESFWKERIALQMQMDIYEFSTRYNKGWTKEQWTTFVNSNGKYGIAFSVNQEMLCERHEKYKNPTYYKNNASDLMLIGANGVITFVKPRK